jgi:RNA polymerase sigma-70 factor (ECF subfamily)
VGLEKLILDCQNNNPKAQEQLYKLFSAKFFGVCLKYSSNYADAQDNLQDGFLILFTKISQFGFKGSFEGWAKRIIVNNALQKFKNAKYLEVITDDITQEIIEEVDIDDDNISMDFLLCCIQELPERYRLVFNLYVLDAYSHKEIAEMLNITTGTTKSNLARARMILKEKIDTFSGRKIIPSAK